MRLGLRSTYLIAAMLLLPLMLPIGQATVLLALFVAADLSAAALMLQRRTASPVRVASISRPGGRSGGDSDMESLALLRRTVPELRMRRPASAIEAQIQWRQAAERRRERREISFSLRQESGRATEAHSPR